MAKSVSANLQQRRLLKALPVTRIISGGQTGVDRGALEAAIEIGIPHGGWCPRGRIAEDGMIPLRFELQETDSPQYHIRTERNVLDADGTLILCWGALTGGTRLTRIFAQRHRKTYRVIDLRTRFPVAFHSVVRCWLREHNIQSLNVAGPRESSRRGIQTLATKFLREVFNRCQPLHDAGAPSRSAVKRKRI